MPKVMKACRVCGRQYEACRTPGNAVGVFRWQEVACSPECGAKYLARLERSRGMRPARKPDSAPAEIKAELGAAASGAPSEESSGGGDARPAPQCGSPDRSGGAESPGRTRWKKGRTSAPAQSDGDHAESADG